MNRVLKVAMSVEQVSVSPSQRGGHSGKEQRVPGRKSVEPPSVQYQLKQVIGKGSYGIVYKAVNKKSRQTVAIKEINYENDEELNEIMIEIDLLKNLNHINIVKYHGFIQKASNLYIILEFASHGSLKNLISKKPSKCLEEEETRMYLKQTLEGLNYLHEQGVIHRDIKAANLLLNSNNIVKLADFGVSTMVNNTAMTLAGSLNWMAPEIITNKGASTLSDIWSLGATVVELMTGNPPFHNLIDINIYYAIENDKYYPPDSLPDLCKKFLNQCFQKSMYKRPTAKQLLQFPWIRDVKGIGVEVPKEDKLSRFRENYNEMDKDWGSDFTEEDDNVGILTNFVAKRLSNTDMYSSPYHALQANMSPVGSPVKISRFMSTDDARNRDPFDEISKDINDIDEEIEVSGYYYLDKIHDGIINKDKLDILFNDCKKNDIVDTIMDLLSNEKKFSTANDIIISLFEFDEKSNNSKVKTAFVNYGGMPKIINNEPIISACFLNDRDTTDPKINKNFSFHFLFQCGIMNNDNIKNFMVNPKLYFEIIYKYLDVTSIRYWYNWCESNLDLELFLKELKSDKKAQSTLIKLASFDNHNRGNNSHWILKRFLPKLITRYPKFKFFKETNKNNSSNIYCIYIILKSLTLMLETPINDDNNNEITSYSYSYTKGSPNVSPVASSALFMSPASTSNSPIRNSYFSTIKKRNNYERLKNINESISQLSLPENCQVWLLSLLKDGNKLIEVNNIHVWKYLTKVCYNASHLDPNFLLALYQNSNLFDLVNFMLKQYKTYESATSGSNLTNKRNLLSILKQWLILFVEISRKKELPVTNQHEELFFKIVIFFTKFEKFCSLSIEIILNILQNNCFNDHKANFVKILRDSSILINIFYVFDPNDINFSTFINRYIKLCSLNLYDDFSDDMLQKGDFLGRIKVFFKLYESSLLIQIDLLKYVKILFINCHLKDPKTATMLDTVVTFLNNNWNQPSGSNSDAKQVGKDSVLLIQLCEDIQNIRLSV